MKTVAHLRQRCELSSMRNLPMFTVEDVEPLLAVVEAAAKLAEWLRPVNSELGFRIGERDIADLRAALAALETP